MSDLPGGRLPTAAERYHFTAVTEPPTLALPGEVVHCPNCLAALPDCDTSGCGQRLARGWRTTTLYGSGGAPSGEPRFQVLVTMTTDETANLVGAATALHISLGEVLAMLAGRVEVEYPGRVVLRDGDE